MNTKLIEFLKDFLSKNDIDGLVINSTNEFLVEYNMLNLNSRYHLTGFTGSTGDVLFTNDKIYLFVDTRYHEQANNEVNHDLIEVVKLPLLKSYLTALEETIPSYFKLGMISTKVSKKFYEILEGRLQSKNSTVRLFNSDPVSEFMKESVEEIKYNVFKVPDHISGVSADEKFQTIKEIAGDKFNILVTALEDIAYLTNMRSYDFEYSSVFPAKAIITEEGVKIYSDCDIPYIGGNYTVLPIKEFENHLKDFNKTSLYIDESQISIHDYKLISQSNKVLQSHLRLFKTVKNEAEINHLKSCFARSDNALKVIYDMINSDKIYSEYDYYEALVKAMKDNGAQSLSFKPIVAAGSNTSIIHYTSPSKEKLVMDGDLLLVDFGGYYEGGYATDTTRTFIKGTPTEEQKVAYTTVLRAYLTAFYNKYNKKASYYSIDRLARETIEKNISKDYAFAHGTGHGVGISVHENPPRVSNSETAI